MPFVWFVAPLTIVGCVFLFFNLPTQAMLFLPIWGAIGLAIYFGYSRAHSNLARGIVDVPELDPDAPPVAAAPLPGIPVQGEADE